MTHRTKFLLSLAGGAFGVYACYRLAYFILEQQGFYQPWDLAILAMIAVIGGSVILLGLFVAVLSTPIMALWELWVKAKNKDKNIELEKEQEIREILQREGVDISTTDALLEKLRN